MDDTFSVDNVRLRSEQRQSVLSVVLQRRRVRPYCARTKESKQDPSSDKKSIVSTGTTSKPSPQTNAHTNMIVNLPYDTSAFLKGTLSKNPHNDLSQHFVATGEWPANFVRDYSRERRFLSFPKYQKLIELKDDLCRKKATPPMWLRRDLRTFDLRELGMQFDVILLNPPVEEYVRRAPGTVTDFWDWDAITALPLEHVASSPAFVFMWVGTGEGLEHGRRAFDKWGFRRSEDICWIKTNKSGQAMHPLPDPEAVLVRTKEHCLMGIRGAVKRSTDTRLIHANVDTDIIIAEDVLYGSRDKPDEIYSIIERFCLGRRRLMLFANDKNIRPGWLSIGPDLSSSSWDPERYAKYFEGGPDAHLIGYDSAIDQLRPKTPPPPGGRR